MSPARVLVAGGGVAGLEAVLALQARGGDRVAPELIAPSRHFVYRPLAVVEPFAEAPVVLRLPLADFGRDRGVPVHRDAVERVRAEERVVETFGGRSLRYDALIVALGARPVEAIPGALTFRGSRDAARVRELVGLASDRRARELAFVVPPGASWPLPLYELLLQTAAAVRGAARATLITPEPSPLAVFGADASATVAALLAERGVVVRTGVSASDYADGRVLTDAGDVAADAAIALAALEGPAMPGLPADPLGFVPVDARGAVPGVADVFVVGDAAAASGPKQGGLAAQQADVAAAAIAARLAGEPLPPVPRPVLRAALMTGTGTLYLRHERGGASEASPEPLWWPPAKIAGRHLSHHLASHLELV